MSLESAVTSAALPRLLGSQVASSGSSHKVLSTKPSHSVHTSCALLRLDGHHDDHHGPSSTPHSVHTSCAVLRLDALSVHSFFDPEHDLCLRLQLLSRLGLREDARIKTLDTSSGRLNEGIWSIDGTEGSSNLVMKLVKRRETPFPSEGEQLVEVSKMHPSLVSDPAVAFPSAIFKCMSSSGEHTYDCIVMPKAAGQELAEVISLKWHQGEMEDILGILLRFGIFLASFHQKYDNCQHGDLHESNIFYDEAADSFVLIDLENLGRSVSHEEGDFEQFYHRLGVLSEVYGEDFCRKCEMQFEEGYNLRKSFRLSAM